MRLDKASLLDIIPSNMRGDRTIRGFAAAWDHMQGKALEKSRLVNLFEALDLLTDGQLDQTADAIDIPWYDTSFDIAKKRRILRDYLPVYLRAGTVWAIETAMGNIFGGATVREWFEYGGRQFHFYVSVTEVESEEKVRMAVRTIDRIKPARTTLDGLIKKSVLAGDAAEGCLFRVSLRTVTHPMPEIGPIEREMEIRGAATAGGIFRQTLRAERRRPPAGDGAVVTGLGLGGAFRQTLRAAVSAAPETE